MTHRNTPRANGDFSCQCGVWGSHGWMGYALHLEPLLDQLDAAQEALRLVEDGARMAVKAGISHGAVIWREELEAIADVARAALAQPEGQE